MMAREGDSVGRGWFENPRVKTFVPLLSSRDEKNIQWNPGPLSCTSSSQIGEWDTPLETMGVPNPTSSFLSPWPVREGPF